MRLRSGSSFSVCGTREGALMLHANWWEGLSFKVVGLKVLGVVQQRLENQIHSEIVSG